ALTQLQSAEPATPVLMELLTSDDAAIRGLAANAIGVTARLYGDKDATAALEKALELEKNPTARISIARTLWRIGSSAQARNALVDMMRHAETKGSRDESTLVLA